LRSTGSLSRLGPLVAFVALAFASVPARADGAPTPPPEPSRPRLVWDPAWPRFRTVEYVATGSLALSTIPTLAVDRSSSPWLGRVAFDESARDALRLTDRTARLTARDASDTLLTIAVQYPLLIDAVLVAAWHHESQDVAWEMAMIDLEAFALNAAVSAWTSTLTSRERPYGRICPEDPSLQTLECSGYKRYRSFFSGHTSTAFTSAGLVCSHHRHLPLYGEPGDSIACGGAIAAAFTMGFLRVTADQHYVTDVTVGAATGALIGFGLPWLLHYGPPARLGRTGPAMSILPSPQGAHVVGVF
jgi:membrane-associated phospholipid phosphatase